MPESAVPPLEGALATATDGGRALGVVREYPDTAEGRSHLEADAALLRAHGYELTAREHRPRPAGWKRSASMLVGLLSFSCVHFGPSSGGGRIVATFELRGSRA